MFAMVERNELWRTIGPSSGTNFGPNPWPTSVRTEHLFPINQTHEHANFDKLHYTRGRGENQTKIELNFFAHQNEISERPASNKINI
jgi:hypothetical protein